MQMAPAEGQEVSGAPASCDCLMITYRSGNDLELDSVIELYRASTLANAAPWTTVCGWG